MEGTTAAADDVVAAEGAAVVVDPVTVARLPPFATKLFLKVSAFVVMAVFRVLAPSAALVLDVVATWNCTATARRENVTIVTSLLVH